MGRIYCSHGLCTSNTIDREVGVKLIPFPKPCAEYINSTLIANSNDHKTKQCAKCSKALRWLHLCKRSDSMLQGLLDINKRTYVCTKHFSNGLGPTEINPDPLPANEVLKPHKPARRAPLDRSCLNVLPPNKIRFSSNSFSTAASEITAIPPSSLESGTNELILIQEQECRQPTNSVRENSNISPICGKSRNEENTYVQEHGSANPKESENSQKLTMLQQMAHKLVDQCVYNKCDNEKLSVIFLGLNEQGPLVEKSCTVDRELNVQIFVLGKEISDNNKIWSKYPNKWQEDFDYLSFFNDLSTNWFVCQSYTDSDCVSKVKDSPSNSDTYKYDLITNSVRSLDCTLLAPSEVCFHCNKMKRNLCAKMRKRPVLTCQRIGNMSREEAQSNLRGSQVKLAQEKLKIKRLTSKLQDFIHSRTSLKNSDSS